MTEHDIRRAAALWNIVRDSHARLTKMAEKWSAEATTTTEGGAAFALCAAELEQYLATWWKDAEEGERVTLTKRRCYHLARETLPSHSTLPLHSTVAWDTTEDNPTDYDWHERISLCTFCSGRLRGAVHREMKKLLGEGEPPP
jgi:hypothetical protein